MSKQLIIGCRKCKKEANNKKLNLIVETGYSKKEYEELFIEDYTCPFCCERIIITPAMLEFAIDFDHKEFNVNLIDHRVEILTTNDLLVFYEEQDLEQTLNEFLNLGSYNNEEFTLNLNEIKIIHHVLKQFNSSKWNIRLESKSTKTPYTR